MRHDVLEQLRRQDEYRTGRSLRDGGVANYCGTTKLSAKFENTVSEAAKNELLRRYVNLENSPPQK